MTLTAAASVAGMCPSGPLAVQAHALRAAACFIEQAGLAGLSVTAGDDGLIIISVSRRAGPPAARAATVAALAAAVGAPEPARTQYRSTAWVASAGTLAGHDTRVTTTIDHDEPGGHNS
jgi:hypothetical protein